MKPLLSVITVIGHQKITHRHPIIGPTWRDYTTLKLELFLWTIRIRIMACLRIIANSLWTHAFESHDICHNKRYCCSKSIWDKCVNVFCTDEASWIRRIGKITSRSGVWNHVKVNGKDETLVKCDYCAWTSNYYSSTTNLWRHLKRLHNIEAWTLFMNSF